MTEEIYTSETHKGREVLYASFSKIFFDIPDEKVLKMLRDIMPALMDMRTDDDRGRLLNEGVKGLENFLKRYDNADNGAEFIKSVNTQFTRVFCLSDSAPVSESVYLSKEHLVMQENEIAVLKEYESLGFTTDYSSSNEPADHISFELMFMSYLAKGTAKRIDEKDFENADKLIEAQRKFLKEHPLLWIDKFIAAVLKFPESYGFYLPAVYFIAGFMKAD
ncbi:MAG: molecular chaperone TorD family protein [Mucispirillum sp.]|nr:molecular chaperone TorD family protein [Mucispirillum sp.]